ncbi:MAG: MptD family putative ECF transporter S component [Chloroflexota bacterium]
MKIKLKTSDLITIGIFSAIYIISYAILSGVLFTPFLFFIMMPLGALLMGPVYMLFIARTQKLGAITIMGFLAATLIGFLVYGNIFIMLVNFGIALVAELLAYVGQYKSFKWNTASYSVMSLWIIGEQGPYWVAKEWMRNLTINSGYTAEYADGMLALATPLNLVILIVLTIICAIISAYVANRMLKKHFVRAGIA